jgi:hypothetical protein
MRQGLSPARREKEKKPTMHSEQDEHCEFRMLKCLSWRTPSAKQPFISISGPLASGKTSFEDYFKWSCGCRSVIAPLVIQMLGVGTSVVLDFAGNTQAEWKWIRSLFEEAGAKHVCLNGQLWRQRHIPSIMEGKTA